MAAVAIIVPCYNEAARLESDVFIEFARLHPDVRFIFVDDGSTDDTFQVLERLQSSPGDGVRVLALPQNRGKAEAVRQGMLKGMAEGAKYVGYWDADLATPLSAITDFVERLECNPGLLLVMGSRVRLLGRDIHRKAHRHYLGRIFATCASLVLRLPIYDTQCGAKLFLNSQPVAFAFRDPFISRWVFDIEIIARLNEAGVNAQAAIYEYPLRQWHDVRGSKIRPADFCTALWDLARIHRRYSRSR